MERVSLWFLNLGKTVVLSVTCFSFSPFPKWHRSASHLILSSSSLRPPLVFHPHPSGIYCISPTSCISPLSFLAFKDDTSDRWENSGAPPVHAHVCHLVQLPGFSPESHLWFLFNTENQSAGVEGTTLCLPGACYTALFYFSVFF